MTELDRIAQKIRDGGRVTFKDSLVLSSQAPIHLLGTLADEIRTRLHPEGVVSYIVDRNINYTNVCVSGCRFCAFFKAPGDPEGYVLSREELAKKIDETLSLGGNQVLLQGGLHPHLPLSFYEDMLAFIKSKGMHCHAFSPPEIVHFARLSGCSIEEVLRRLIASGLDSLPGGGAEILVDRVRGAIAPKKATTAEWLSVMETAHRLGLKTTATMMFGHVETPQERIEHMMLIRDLQDRTRGFTAFIPWPFQPRNTHISQQPATAQEYLKVLALSRIVLDNVPNIQASWVTQGPKVAQVSLFFGANDFGSTMIEENVVSATGVLHRLSEEEIRRIIEAAGFRPSRRTMDYRLLNGCQ